MGLDVSAVRAAYPALADGYAYLDGAAGTQLPAPVIDTFSDSLAATSACDAPVEEISAVLVWRDAASNLLAPVMSVMSSSTVPSIIILAAPVDSIAKLRPESCFAVRRAAPRYEHEGPTVPDPAQNAAPAALR